jgi:hypothetical protein
MSEPAKKPGQQPAPESYQPKAAPEIMRALGGNRSQGEDSTASQAASSSGGSTIVPLIRPMVSDMRGENYWFNGCAAYAMECLGRPELNYWLFGGLTGDNFTQFYALKKDYGACAVSDIFMSPAYVKWAFEQVGYACEYVTEKELLADREYYLQKLMDSIDRGVPVICSNWGMFVGYEDGGKTLLYITHEMEAPGRLTAGGERFIEEREFYYTDERKMPLEHFDLIFVGEKTRDIPLAQIYREAIQRLPQLLTTQMDDFRFGADAFRAFADDIEGGKFDDPAVLAEQEWNSYTNYICVLATNGSCCFSFLDKAMELNPDMAWLKKIGALYKKMGKMWGGDKPSIGCLEKLGGGFNVKYETLQKPGKRKKIVAKLREFAICADEVLRILKKGAEAL